MTIISTYADVNKFVTSALVGLGATEQDPSGRFYLDGNMVNVELSQVIAEAIYIQDIFRDGQSVTGKYVTGHKQGGAVRVMLDKPYPFSSRTTAFGGRKGTVGNSGVINNNASLLPGNDEFMVYLNQVNDQRMLFPDLGKQYLPMDIMATKLAGYASRVSMDRSASTLAEIIAYNVFRALNGGDNLMTFNKTTENAYNTLLNDLNSALDNGDITMGAYTYATSGRTIIARPNFANGIFSSKSGVILNGSNLAQEMLKSYNLEASLNSNKYVGTGYKGNAMQFDIQSAPDYIWTLAESYLGLSAGALNFVEAIAVSFEATAVASNIDLGVKIVDSQGTSGRGLEAQPLNIWGHEAIRKSYIVGSTTNTTDKWTSLGFTANSRVYPVAPSMASMGVSFNEITVPIYDDTGAIIGYKVAAKAAQPNGGNFQAISQAEAPIPSKPAGVVTSGTTITLTSATPNAKIYYTTDGYKPNSSSMLYTAGIVITEGITIKAIAIAQNSVASGLMTAKYTVS